MATKKSKSSSQSTKTRTTSSKTAARAVEKPEVKASTKKSVLAGFFAKKYDEKESITTVFKQPKFYGALLGELIGTMLIGFLLFSLFQMQLTQIAIYSFALVAILICVYAFSGACLNPIVAVGMMASRRLSVVRGIMYIVAEIIGAWLAWLIFNACQLAGGEAAAITAASLTEIAVDGFWLVAAVEFIGACLIGFFFARALEYKRSVFTFAAVVTGGIVLAILLGYVISAGYFGLTNNYIFNPAIALMMQIFPTAGENFGEILGGICQALSAYAIIPMIGGVVGFYVSDFVHKLTED